MTGARFPRLPWFTCRTRASSRAGRLLLSALVLVPALTLAASARGLGQTSSSSGPSTECPSSPGAEAAIWITGRVEAADTGVALPGAEVVLTWDEGDRVRRMTMQAGPSGTYRFCRLEPDRHLTLHASAAGRSGVMYAVDTRPGAEVVRQDLEVVVSEGREGRIVGRVLDQRSGEGVESATLRLEEQGVETATRHDGRFTLEDVRSGTHTLAFHHVVYGEHEMSVDVGPKETVEITLAVTEEPVEMEPVEATVRHRYAALERQGFYERQHWAEARGGTFITPEMIERRRPSRVSHLLEGVPGVRIVRSCQGPVCGSFPLFHRNYGCRARAPETETGVQVSVPQVYVDGVKYDIQETVKGIDQFNASTIRAIELYGDAAQVPAEFLGSDSRCGVIVVWTKRGPDRRSEP